MTDCIYLLFQKLEDRHGYLMVAHSLAYTTAAKNGITEAEIEDLVSLGQYEICRYVSLFAQLKFSAPFVQFFNCLLVKNL